jgi:hypothetical protein
MPRIEIIRRKIKRAHGAALSKDEEKAVELAFSALSCIGGSAERRLTAARNFNKSHLVYDVTKPSPRTWFKYNRSVSTVTYVNAQEQKPLANVGINEDTEKEWETLKLQSPRTDTTWRLIKSKDGNIRPIEILKPQKVKKKKKSYLEERRGIKRFPCAYCRLYFRPENLVGGTSRMSIARLRETNCKINKGSGKNVDLPIAGKDTIKQMRKYGCCRGYEMVHVCAFCFQFFDYDVALSRSDPQPSSDLALLPNSRNAKIQFDLKQTAKKTGHPDSDNDFVVSYKSRASQLNSPFKQTVSVHSSQVLSQHYKPRSRRPMTHSAQNRARNGVNLGCFTPTPPVYSNYPIIRAATATPSFRKTVVPTPGSLDMNSTATSPRSKRGSRPMARAASPRSKSFRASQVRRSSPYARWMTLLGDTEREQKRLANTISHAYPVPFYAKGGN